MCVYSECFEAAMKVKRKKYLFFSERKGRIHIIIIHLEGLVGGWAMADIALFGVLLLSSKVVEIVGERV